MLIRALEPTHGLERDGGAARRRPTSRLLCSGPGRLCQALGVTREHDGLRARPAAVRAATARAGRRRDRRRPADRDHEGGRAALALRPRRLALPQPPVPFTVSVIASPGAAARRGATDCAVTLPSESPLVTTPRSSAAPACARALSSGRPTTLRHDAVRGLRQHDRDPVVRRRRAFGAGTGATTTPSALGSASRACRRRRASAAAPASRAFASASGWPTHVGDLDLVRLAGRDLATGPRR